MPAGPAAEPVTSIQQALACMGAGNATLAATDAAQLDTEGYVVLRGAIPPLWLEPLQARFEHNYLPSHLWPAPREQGTRYAVLDHDPLVHDVCLLPSLLACAFHILRRRFFLAHVQGRDPKVGGGYQNLHRDWVAEKGPAPMVLAFAFLDPFESDNGGLRLLPGTHREEGGSDAYTAAGPFHPRQLVMTGNPGDIIVMDGFLVHSGTRNTSGKSRRSLQLTFRGAEAREIQDPVRDFSGVAAARRYLLGEDVPCHSGNGSRAGPSAV